MLWGGWGGWSNPSVGMDGLLDPSAPKSRAEEEDSKSQFSSAALWKGKVSRNFNFHRKGNKDKRPWHSPLKKKGDTGTSQHGKRTPKAESKVVKCWMRLCMCVSAAAYAWEVNCKSWGWEETSSSSEFATYLMLVRMLTLQPFPADKWPLSQSLFSLFIYLFPFPKGHKKSKTNENKKKIKPTKKQTNKPQTLNYWSAEISLVAYVTDKLLLCMDKHSNHVLSCLCWEVAQIVPSLLSGSARAVRSLAQGNPVWSPEVMAPCCRVCSLLCSME